LEFLIPPSPTQESKITSGDANQPKKRQGPRTLSTSLLNDGAVTMGTQDRLGFEPTAETLASFISSTGTATPLVIAVNAKWGAGKSSLVNFVTEKLERRLDLEAFYYAANERLYLKSFFDWCVTNQPGSGFHRLGQAVRSARPLNSRLRHTVVRFDAWMHDDAPQIASAFAKQIIIAASSARPLVWQILRPVSFKYSGKVAILGTLSVLALSYFAIGLVSLTFFPDFSVRCISQLEGLFRSAGSKGAHPAGGWFGKAEATAPTLFGIVGLTAKQVKEFFDSVNKYIKSPERASSEASLAKVNERLRGLIQQATTNNRRFIIYVDNLERCKPENALSLLEVINQLLSHPQVVTIIAADMEIIAASAGSRFKEQAKLLATSEGTEAGICLEYGRRYVRKMVQLNVSLPKPSPAQLGRLGEDREAG